MESKIISREDRAIDIVITILSIITLIVCVYPLYFVIIASFSDPTLVATGKVLLFPKGLTLAAYDFIFKDRDIWMGYGNTIVYTVLSVLFGLAVILPGAYALSRKDFIGRKPILMLLTFTMFFQGGLIPTYVMVGKYGLLNTKAILIILNSVTVFNIIIARTFFKSTLPDELFEAASIDGCGNVQFFLQIALPLSKTIIVVLALYIAVWQWNSYFNALIYTTNRKLMPLQLVLRELLVQGQNLSSTDDMDAESIRYLMEIAQLIKYGVIVVSTLPIIIAYPFAQKYFVKGVMIGSVKG